MKNFVAGTLLVAAVIGIAGWWQVYKFHDCKRVGHSTFYCVMDIGK